MFEPRRLSIEEAQHRLSCGWYVDCSVISHHIPHFVYPFPLVEKPVFAEKPVHQTAGQFEFHTATCDMTPGA